VGLGPVKNIKGKGTCSSGLSYKTFNPLSRGTSTASGSTGIGNFVD